MKPSLKRLPLYKPINLIYIRIRMLNVKSFSLVGFIKKPYVNVSSNLVSLRDLEIDSQLREVSETHTAEQYISCYVKTLSRTTSRFSSSPQ